MRVGILFPLIWLRAFPLLCAGLPQPSAWVPARWPWPETKSLELLAGSPVNCLLLQSYNPEFLAAAAEHGLVTLAVITPGKDSLAAARKALAAKVTGIVMEGDFPESDASAVKQAAGGAPFVEVTSRTRVPLGSGLPIVGTYQGVWPGIVPMESRAGPTGATWILTNTGFIRAVRAWGGATLWLANRPPANTVVTGTRYRQAIADAAMSGARWVLSLDTGFAERLHHREERAVSDWTSMNQVLRHFEQHPEWRGMHEYGMLALVQDPAKSGLVSGGILDMIAVKRIPLRVVPRQLLSAAALADVRVVLNVDAAELSAEQDRVLRDFTASGGLVLSGPKGWTDEKPKGDSFTLDQPDLDRLDELAKEVDARISRNSLGVRVFNAASMLSHVLVSSDEKTIVVHLVNYSDYPVQNLTLMFPGRYKAATLIAPEGSAPIRDIFQTPDSSGLGVDRVSVCAAISLTQ